MTATTTSPANIRPRPATQPRPRYGLALWLVWAVYALIFLSVGVGGTLDRIWHLAYPLEDFFSPPHIIIYIFSTLAGFVVMGMVFTHRVRRAYGRGFDVKILPFKVPGALFILGGGLAMVGFAGLVLDNYWHSNFGLDETGWSFPHAMLGWTALLTALGLLACRLALRPHRKLRWYTKLALGFAVMLFTTAPFMGPIGDNRTPEVVDLALAVPVLANDAEFMHTHRIYQQWNLNRTHPALLLLAPLWLGAVLGFLRRLDRRWWMLLLFVGLLWLLDNSRSDLERIVAYFPTLLDNPANYQALPVMLPTLLILLLPRLRLRERRAWIIAGVMFCLQIYGIWGQNPAALLLIPFGGALILLGKAVGERAYTIVEQPYTFRTVLPLMGAAVVFPLITGIIDLILRFQTP